MIQYGRAEFLYFLPNSKNYDLKFAIFHVLIN